MVGGSSRNVSNEIERTFKDITQVRGLKKSLRESLNSMNTEQTIDGIAVEWFRKMCVSQFHFSSPFFSPIYYSLFDFHKCEKKNL